MKSSLLFALLLLLLLVVQSEGVCRCRHRQRKSHRNATQILRIPFVRQTSESPQVVEVLVGTPPQKLKLAITYGVHDSDHVITLMDAKDRAYQCPHGKNVSRYNSKASKTFEELPAGRENDGVNHREKFAFAADPAHVQSVEFLHSSSVYEGYRCMEEIAGVLPLHALRLSSLWISLLARKPAPIVTVVADTKPRINGAFQTGELVIGGLNEEKCGKDPKFVDTTDIAWFGTKNHTLNGQKVQLNKDEWDSALMAVDLSANQTLIEKKHWKKFVKEGLFKTDPTDGRVYVPCDSKQTFGFTRSDGDRMEVPLTVDQSRRNARGLCLLRVAETRVWTTLSAGLLDDHCVHFDFHEKVGQTLTKLQEEEKLEGMHQVAFSKRH